MVKTAVVILNWNGIKWLQRFLETVVRFTADENTDIFVADNGSTDGSLQWISDSFKNVRCISLGKNYGFAGGYNLALEQIEAKYYVLLNSDIEVTEGWLKPLIVHMDQNPDVASCQPKIRSFTSREYFEYAGAAGGYIDKFGYTFCRGRIIDFVEIDSGQYNDQRNIFWSTGACMVVRSESWYRCGRFDEDFFAHMEEIDLCWRFHHTGYLVSYIPDSVVYHVGGGTLPYSSFKKTYLNFRNSLFLLYKNLPPRRLHFILFIRKVLDGIAAIMFIFKGTPGNAKAILKAHIDYYRSLGRLRTKRAYVMDLASKGKNIQLMNKSIVFRFYIMNVKTFSKLVKNK